MTPWQRIAFNSPCSEETAFQQAQFSHLTGLWRVALVVDATPGIFES